MSSPVRCIARTIVAPVTLAAIASLVASAGCGSSNRAIRRAAAERLPCAAVHGKVSRVSDDQAIVGCQFKQVFVSKREGVWTVTEGPHSSTCGDHAAAARAEERDEDEEP